MQYVENIRTKSAIAAKVKLADLKHNSDLSRLDNPTEKDYERAKKYACAIEILENNKK